MFNVVEQFPDLDERMKMLHRMVMEQLHEESDYIANLSNISALVYYFMEDLNWAGFYLMKDGELVLGPFQGLPACNRIAVGSGVCGTAVAEKESQLVPDVHAFPGHIACDSASESELVIPLINGGEVIGVLDLDSPTKDRFTEKERDYLEQLLKEAMPLLIRE